jgi:LPS export ABC transporter protein LptC
MKRARRGVRGYLPMLALCASVAVACSDTTQAPIADPTLLDLEADNVIYGMSSYLTTHGIREGLIRADTAYMYVDSAHVDLRGMTIVFHSEDGSPRATVTGRTGEWDQERDIMVARGDVLLIVHADDREIRTEELHYDAYRERIWSDSATTQTLPDGTVTRGSAFESDLGFQDLRIENVRGGARRAP